MINPESLFSVLNFLVLLIWALMVIAPKWKVTLKLVSTFSVTVILSLIYAVIIFMSFGKINFADFGSLAGIMKIFQNSNLWGTSAIWYHLLAFDLFVGSWILKDSQRLGIPHLWIVPCLLICFMLGPIGFLLYQMIKFFYLKFSQRGLKTN